MVFSLDFEGTRGKNLPPNYNENYKKDISCNKNAVIMIMAVDNLPTKSYKEGFHGGVALTGKFCQF